MPVIEPELRGRAKARRKRPTLLKSSARAIPLHMRLDGGEMPEWSANKRVLPVSRYHGPGRYVVIYQGAAVAAHVHREGQGAIMVQVFPAHLLPPMTHAEFMEIVLGMVERDEPAEAALLKLLQDINRRGI
jgi:hypothetical protein